ncbi:MAG: hypothetical protein WA364_03970 [Candidatus Nitrosopolaris sp.]
MGFVISFIIYHPPHHLMNPKTGVAFSIVAIAAVIMLFASGPLAATKAQAFGGFGGFHRGFGFGGFHRGFDFGGFHRGFGFGGFGGGCGGFGGCGGCF